MPRELFLLIFFLCAIQMLSALRLTNCNGVRSLKTVGGYVRSSHSKITAFDQSKTISSVNTDHTVHTGHANLKNTAPVILGIAGGSASGKTTLAKAIIQSLGSEHVSFIGHDSYYHELPHLSVKERAEVNFDHPSSLDTQLLIQHIQNLKNGKSVHVPIYDFSSHARTGNTEEVIPKKIIIIDGILIFSEPQLLNLMDMKIFVDTDDDIRLIRRIKRDITERKRSIDSIITQYQYTVRPMHLLYVEPSKRCADIIVPAGDGIQPVALDMCVSRLREIIQMQH